MNREDFVFLVGFKRDVAIVSKAMVKKYGKFSTNQLLQEGLYRSAFCSALFGGVEAEMQAVVDRVNEDCGLTIKSSQQLMRLYGVFSVPPSGIKIKLL